MQLLEAIFLGLVQGLTEFIPVSSSGHLILAGNLIGAHQSQAFDIALHLGTLLAVIWFFWPEFWKMAKAVHRQTADGRLARIIILATIPGVIAGVALETAVQTVFRSNIPVALALIGVAPIMLLAEYLGKRSLQVPDLRWPPGLLIGIAQALAVIPGVSRSGATISAGMLLNFDRVAATRFSFLLSGPIIAGASLKVLSEGQSINQISAEPLMFVIGLVTAAASGYAAIRFMLNYLSRRSLHVFAYYRIVIGFLIIALELWQ